MDLTRPGARVGTLYLLVGLPASGKTTRAVELERSGALRLSPDEWMIPLFGESEAGGARDVLEGRLISVALRVLVLGADVVLDFGFWGRDERSALRSLAAALGSRAVVEYLAVDEDEQWRRIESRYATAPGTTFPLSREDLAGFRDVFQPPDAAEQEVVPGSPQVWADWASTRWPSLTVPPLP